ncbi:MAG: cupredoxin domain-containing protein [Alphaproteobacteria bacterium]
MLKMMVLSLAASALASAIAAAEHRITMAGSDYAPASIEAKVGDTLVFENDDTEAHNVFVPTVGFSTDLGKQDPGKSARLLLTKPGSFEVECVFHQDMNMRVTVKP